MLLTVDQVAAVPDVPVGKFFYMKPQGGEPRFAFMAKQTAKREDEYEGPVVLTFPADGRWSLPRNPEIYQLGIAAILSDVRVAVDTDDIGDTSTETFGVPAGLMLLSGEHRLITLQWGELDSATYVNLNTGELRMSSEAGKWLSFKKWQLQDAEGRVLYSGTAHNPEQH